MHNHDGKNGNWMMWLMMICCAIPLVLSVIFGLGGRALGVPTWIILGMVALGIIVHFYMMHRSHNHVNEKRSTLAKDGKDENGLDQSDHGSH